MIVCDILYSSLMNRIIFFSRCQTRMSGKGKGKRSKPAIGVGAENRSRSPNGNGFSSSSNGGGGGSTNGDHSKKAKYENGGKNGLAKNGHNTNGEWNSRKKPSQLQIRTTLADEGIK